MLMFGLVRVLPVELLHQSGDSILGFITPLLDGCLKGHLSHDHANNASIMVYLTTTNNFTLTINSNYNSVVL